MSDIVKPGSLLSKGSGSGGGGAIPPIPALLPGVCQSDAPPVNNLFTSDISSSESDYVQQSDVA